MASTISTRGILHRTVMSQLQTHHYVNTKKTLKIRAVAVIADVAVSCSGSTLPAPHLPLADRSASSEYLATLPCFRPSLNCVDPLQNYWAAFVYCSDSSCVWSVCSDAVPPQSNLPQHESSLDSAIFLTAAHWCFPLTVIRSCRLAPGSSDWPFSSAF